MSEHYDYAVLGLGGIGSAACYWLAKTTGKRVLGVEQFQLGHDHGASQDHSRIIRRSYHKPEYAALTQAAYDTWHEVEAEAGLQLVIQSGGLDLGDGTDASNASLAEFAATMDRFDIPYEELSATQVGDRWPQFQLRPGDRALYQQQSGLVDARRANATHMALARAHGAVIRPGTPVRKVHVGQPVELLTDQWSATADALVIATGAWTAPLLADIGVDVPLSVSQEQVTYFATPHLADFQPSRFPVWIWHFGDQTDFYGLPIHGEIATKATRELLVNAVTPDTRTYEPNREAVEQLTAFLAERIPGFLGPELYTKTCLYTLPADRGFILDTLPGHPNVATVVGAGHAFKFASLLGRICGQLVSEGGTPHPIDAFSLSRPQLRTSGGLEQLIM